MKKIFKTVKWGALLAPFLAISIIEGVFLSIEKVFYIMCEDIKR